MNRPTVPEVEPLARAYYEKPGNAAGGNLHVVLDDGNIDDRSIQFCLGEAQKHGDEDGVALCQLLLSMSRTGRRRVVGR